MCVPATADTAARREVRCGGRARHEGAVDVRDGGEGAAERHEASLCGIGKTALFIERLLAERTRTRPQQTARRAGCGPRRRRARKRTSSPVTKSDPRAPWSLLSVRRPAVSDCTPGRVFVAPM